MATKRPSKAKPAATFRTKTAAQFFADNKHFAGFDNPSKSLYTTVREFVENGLDAAESPGMPPNTFPHIDISLEEIDPKIARKQIGITDSLEKDDAEDAADVYWDPESKSDGPTRTTTAAEATEKSGGKAPKKVEFWKVTCKDNGVGMRHEEIPELLGQVLTGTKYGAKQTRGKFGLGAKMALIAGKQAGFPTIIRSAKKNSPFVSFCELDMDLHLNKPRPNIHEKLPNEAHWRGTEIQVTIQGAMPPIYHTKMTTYFRSLAVITPHATFVLKIAPLHKQKPLIIEYSRRSDKIPKPVVEVNYHPSAMDATILEDLLRHTKAKTLESFLHKELQGIKPSRAKRMLEELGSSFPPDISVKDVLEHTKLIHKLKDYLQKGDFGKPDAKCLSPVEEYNLKLGIIKEYDPQFVATHTLAPRSYNGHPFVVEAAVTIGGAGEKEGVEIHRFANRIPLIWEPGSDVSTHVATGHSKNRHDKTCLNWGLYKINPKTDKINVFVSIVSTKVPFKGTGKEFISKEVLPIAEAIKQALQKCCGQLKQFIVKHDQAKSRAGAQDALKKYIPGISGSLFKTLSTMKERRDARMSAGGGTGSRGGMDVDDEAVEAVGAGSSSDGTPSAQTDALLVQFGKGDISKTLLSKRLEGYIDQKFAAQNLEYAQHTMLKVGQGTREPVFFTAMAAGSALSRTDGQDTGADVHDPGDLIEPLTKRRRTGVKISHPHATPILRHPLCDFQIHLSAATSLGLGGSKNDEPLWG